ncbi:Twin-arginine translocation pathway signal and cupin region containing protein [Fictibacillus macauensis ZFHKF-1]|uniref:Twin-arginine translocation pathway signal and cupin region containing protein n=1 Tax=Fictibacillus macauensis ZFHKF-1 TaxID=1196324 RepID=I8J1R8_9BACL|nr:cupin domain-containing protein [Fictibacillus macauensis]EIT85681.1 Twin-arginine translocation pathway signal and cupin region containing protein [Fictibacillus macauensis ZFHKF-1]
MDIQTFLFEDDGFIPNNPTLPVLLYRQAVQEPISVERIFNQNLWLNSWTNGIFSYHHYHSTTHEVLGVKEGFATVKIGGKQGEELQVHAGDIIVLPAGTGHMNVDSSADFTVVGAYPNGMSYDVQRGIDGERPDVLVAIKNVPIPITDPLYGEGGPLTKYWKD